MGAGAREPLLAGESWGAALYQVVEFPISRWMVGSPGGNPGACSRGTAVPEWLATVHRVTKSRTQLGDFTFTFHFHALEKEMATHSSVLAWRIPGTGEPGKA